MRRMGPLAVLSVPSAATVTARTRFAPCVAAMTDPVWSATPASFSAGASAAAGRGRLSTTAATAPPASTMSRAAS